MEIVSDEDQLNYYMANAVEASTIADAPILIDKFLDAATEVDVDCLADFDPAAGKGARGWGKDSADRRVGDRHRRHGAHRGSRHSLRRQRLLAAAVLAVEGDRRALKDQTRALAKALRVRGLMNVQYAIKDNEIYVIEVNPRASRTVPFVSKATGVPWAKIAAKVMAGKSLAELGVTEPPDPKHTS
jgi:carbamoyl-phosphate synthase large subunit